MSETDKILLNSTSTIIGGVIIFVLGQILSKFVIDPLQDFKRSIGEVADMLIYYANVYANPGVPTVEVIDEAARQARQKAALLRVRAHAVPWYGLFALLRVVPKRRELGIAASKLIYLSNSVHDARNTDRNTDVLTAIGKALKIPVD